MKQGPLHAIQLIETDSKRNIARYPGESDDISKYCVISRLRLLDLAKVRAFGIGQDVGCEFFHGSIPFNNEFRIH